MTPSWIGFGEQDRHALEQQLRLWWTSALGVAEFGIHDDFFQLGGDPERSSILLSRIRAELGVTIGAQELFEARTLAKQIDLIQLRQALLDEACIVPLRPGGARTPLFLIHGVGGNVLGFANLARALDAEQPVYGIQAQALQSRQPVLLQLEAMASYYVQEVRRVQPHGPYAFLGLSYGGLVAYEMAQQLMAAGEPVLLLGMLDTWQPGYMRQLPRAPWHRALAGRLRRVAMHTRKLSTWQTVTYTAGRLRGRALRLMYGRMGRARAVTLPESMRKVRDINLIAGARYSLRPYPGRIRLFRAYDGPGVSLPEDLGWRAWAAGGVEIFRLPGDHGQILAEPNLSFLAANLSGLLCGPENAFPAAGERTDFDLGLDPGSEPGLEAAGGAGYEVPTAVPGSSFSIPVLRDHQMVAVPSLVVPIDPAGQGPEAAASPDHGRETLPTAGVSKALS